ncbi:MAG: hypothetical protein L6R42_000194 [Xanthoria sp. 1 TBL-2021]|nr:MAG: hypothetical protein L6R42_000194 [Xanthoria sp. 1 TBL-2021]
MSTSITQVEKSPLSRAIRTGDADTLRRLLDEGAKPSDDDISEAQNGEFPEVCKVLITAGFMDINEDSEHAGDLLINMVWELKVDFVRWLLEHGADPNSGHLMADSTSAFCAAAEKGHLPLATMLLEHGAHVSGTAALPGAAGRGHLEMVRFLLERGAAIDEVGVHDFGDRRKKIHEGTALHKAAERGDIEMARVLLDRGAGIKVRDPFDRTPLVRAREKGQDEMVEFLKSRGTKD